MNKFLLTAALITSFTLFAQAKERKITEERPPAANLYRPIPRTEINPNGGASTRWRIATIKPTQHFYTKNSVISYRYAQDLESADGVLQGYMGPRSAVFLQPNDFTTLSSIRSYVSMENRNQPGVSMAPRTEAPLDKVKKSAKSAETSIQLAQQR